MTYRQPKLSLAFRLVAVGCVVLWLAGVSACSLEALFGCDSHGDGAHAHADHGESHDSEPVDTHDLHEADGHHSHDAEVDHRTDTHHDSRSSHKHEGKEGSCCSTLKATAVAAKPVVITKSALQPVSLLCVLVGACVSALNAPDKASTRPPPNRDWVFMHEMCTAAANRAHAPPVFI